MDKRLMFNKIKTIWDIARRLSGDDAYERYLKHLERHHSHNYPDLSVHEGCQIPLSKAEFYKQWQDEKWKGIKRCC
jgi:uncharacterized short protein YbdD (DUF466 family)